MTLYNKVGGALKQVQSLPVMINGEIKDISTLYSKKDGAIVVVFSSGAIIEFQDYPYAIPVASGWQYSTDGKTWTTVEASPTLPYDLSYIFLNVTDNGDSTFPVYVHGVSIIDSSSVTSIEMDIMYSLLDDMGDEAGALEKTITIAVTDFVDGGVITTLQTTGTITTAAIQDVRIYNAEGNVIQTLDSVSTPSFPEITGSSIQTQYYNFSNMTVFTFSESNGAGSFTWCYQIRGVTQLIADAPTDIRVYLNPLTTGDVLYEDTFYMEGTGIANIGGVSVITTDESDGEIIRIEVLDADGNVVQTYFPGQPSVLPFTGYVKAKGELSLTDYYNRTGVGDTPVNVGLRKDGTALSTARYYSCAFVNGGKGYVCGGTTGSASAVVNTYDESGTMATGTALSTARWGSMTFVNGDYGFVCGGRTASSTATTVTNLYNSSGTRTTGTALSYDRAYGTGFTHGDYGYVAGGIRSSSTYRNYVERYSATGTRSTGTALGGSRAYLTSFVLGDYAYVCGGQSSSSTYQRTVYKYNTSGSMTTGTSLSITRSMLTSFVNGDKGYVCGGYTGSAKTNVDVYNTSGTRSTGTALSVARYESASFVLDGYGFVCGGSGYSAVVDVYDESGTRTTGNTLSAGRSRSVAFAVGNNGFVCGGYASNGTTSSVVDQYYHEYETLYFADIPVTEGSTYTLNSESGTADVSEVMTINGKTTGTIKYKAGDLLPGVQITVVDASGNVVEGAEITMDYRYAVEGFDFSGIRVNYIGTASRWSVYNIGLPSDVVNAKDVIHSMNMKFTSGSYVTSFNVTEIYPASSGNTLFYWIDLDRSKYTSGTFEIEFFDEDGFSLGIGTCDWGA